MSWREMISREMEEYNETWDDVVMSNIKKNVEEWHDDEDISEMPEASFDRNFDSGWGGTEGDLFLVWTKERVYFPVCYDGSEWVGSVPRNPVTDVVSKHHGGG